jgi:metal-dependent hydrolase (beta-lactamase superfamily II)
MNGQEELDSLRVTVGAEDSVLHGSSLLGQHGISMFLEARKGPNTRNILVDVAQNPQALGQLEIGSVLAGHCTGFRAQTELFKVFGERFTPLRTGMRIEY